MSLTDLGRLTIHPIRVALLRPWDWFFYFIDRRTDHWIQRPRFRSQWPNPARAEGTEHEQCQLHYLCESCRLIFGRSKLLHGSWLLWIPNSEVHMLHDSVTNLTRAVEDQCHFCTLVWEHLTNDTAAPVRSGDDACWIEITTAFGDWSRTYHVYVHLGARPSVGNIHRIRSDRAAFGAFHGEPSGAPSMQFSHKTRAALSLYYTSTISPGHIQLAQYWLSECLRHHPKCGRVATGFAPTRLLDVGSLGIPNLRLHVCHPGEQDIRYCTLSHCWGDAGDILTLKSTNFALLKERIEYSSIPKTFQDAVAFTRLLGLRYLWIDSLCIISDSRDDWTSEAAQMGKIYENSICTIAAAAAENPHDGCFSTRNPLTFARCHIAGSRLEGKGIYVESSTRDLMQYNSRLDTRAWVLQEKMLSSRTLRFEKFGITWNCNLGSATEQDVYGEGTCLLENDDGYNIGPLFGHGMWNAIWSAKSVRDYDFASSFLHHVGSGRDLVVDFHRKWFRLVHDYSKLELTRPTDKLTALSGLAELVRIKTGKRYLAGMWEDTLQHDLLWKISGKLATRPTAYRAPSWSWASVDGTVSTAQATNLYLDDEGLQKGPDEGTTTIFLAKVHSAEVSTALVDTTKTGQVLDSTLTIMGRLKRIEVKTMGYRAEGLDVRRGEFADGKNLRYFPDCLEPVSEGFLLPVKQVVIHAQGETIFEYQFRLRIEGLVLTAAYNSYVRVGFFRFCCRQFDQGIVEWFADCPFQTIMIK